MPKSNVRVFLRLRPSAQSCESIVPQSDGKSICILNRKGTGRVAEGGQQDSLLFKFDGVYQNVGQDVIFEESAREVVENVVSGFNGTIFAYGQTGSGKTLTMSGEPRVFSQRGITPRAIHEIFQAAESKPEGSVHIRVSYLEIYNETMYDLLADTPGHLNGLTVTEDANGAVEVRGLTRRPVSSEEAALGCFFEGEAARSTASHYLNGASSRSHCIFTVHVEVEAGVGSAEKVTSSKLHLVDLAGSERLKKTHVTGESLREATAINKSLTFLEQVVNALAKNQPHVTFRQTKLTSVLKDALGGNCKTVMIACCWAEDDFLEETLSTLRFAQRVKSLTTTATVSEKTDPATMIRRLERQVVELKQELAMKDALSGKGRVSYTSSSEADLQELRGKISRVLSGDSSLDELPMDSVKQIKETYRLFKEVYTKSRAELERDLATMRDSRPTSQQAIFQRDASTSGSGEGAASAAANGVGEVDPNPGRSFPVGEAPTEARPKDTSYMDRGASAAAGTPKAAHSGGTAGRIADIQSGMPESPTAKETETDRKNRVRQQRRAFWKRMAFLQYKHDEAEGKAANGRLQELSNKIREGRLTVRELGTKVNDSKHEIDQLRMTLDARKGAGRSGQAPAGIDVPEDAEVLDEEQFTLLQKIKTAKAAYRQSFDQLRALRADLEELESEAALCRQNLLEGFSRWFASQGHSSSAMGPLEHEEDNREEVYHTGQGPSAGGAFPGDEESHAYFAAQKAAGTQRGSPTHRAARR